MTPLAQAQTDANGENSATISKSLDRIEATLKQRNSDVQDLDEHISSMTRYRTWAQSCIDREEQALVKLDAQLEVLGEAVKGESKDVSRQRDSLGQEKSKTEKTLSTCQVILQRTSQLAADANAIKKARLAAELTARGPNVIALMLDNWHNPAAWVEASKSFVLENSGLEDISFRDLLLLAFAAGVAVAGGGYLRKRIRNRLQRLDAPQSSSDLFYRSLLFTLQRYVQALMVALVAAGFFYLEAAGRDTVSFINIVAYGVPLVILLLAFIDLFFKPAETEQHFAAKVSATATQLRRRLKVLVVLIFVGYLLFSTILAQSLPEPALLLTRAIYGVFMIINLIWISWLIGRFQHSGRQLVFRLAVSVLFIITLSAELLGYRNLSVYVFQILIGSLTALGLYKLFSDLLRDQLDSLDQDKGRWQHRIRNLLGLKPDQRVPGLVWLRVVVTLFLWGALASALMLIWQVPEATIENLIGYLRNGFTIGSFDIRPVNILQGILVLSALLAINSLFRKWLEQEWLNRSQMERGARESVATISGYIGVAIAIVIALGVSGMDFSKLAIIAGALSVGIGFGLQNIVNNFVSGLILLFERPIKTGDWIIVGTTEGYVKKISIRSTRIQTFDRSDVIVPNSELVASSVTNWMFQDISGRARIPVGVAYGSDTEKVKKLLLAIADSHPEVITDGFLAPKPIVLFMAFGDSSLNFELRCHIRNIDRRLTVVSDINFEIDKAFRANGIEIPFPQRDLHVRDWSPPSSDKPGDDLAPPS
ncbi:MAG: mechanosensitive ion channel family protein [Thiogranum sp.]|nr:mechanosensitive ion channel family protein [Thiogranum sp.]